MTDRGYTDAEVFELELSSRDIARLLHHEWAPAHSWRRMEPEVIECIVYDALVALRNEMAEEED